MIKIKIGRKAKERAGVEELTRAMKSNHMEDIGMLEHKISTPEDTVWFMGNFMGNLNRKIDLEKAQEVFGENFEQFWEGYAINNLYFAVRIASKEREQEWVKDDKSHTGERSRYDEFELIEEVTDPELYIKGLESRLTHLLSTGSKRDLEAFKDVLKYAARIGDPNLVQRYSARIAGESRLNSDELLVLANKTGSYYLLARAGELREREGNLMIESGNSKEILPEKNFFVRGRDYEDVDKDVDNINKAAYMYKDAWVSKNQRDKKFRQEKYDDRELMKDVLGRLTSKSGDELAEFEGKVYSTVYKLMDWDFYAKYIPS